jgi:putative aldouronate transport system permease protein
MINVTGAGTAPGPVPRPVEPQGATVRPAARRQTAVARFTIHLVLVALSAVFVLPLLLVISASVSDENALGKYGYSFLPQHFTTFAYQYIFEDPGQLLRAYGVTVVVTAVGSGVSLLVMALLAYPLARRDFRPRKPLSFYVFFPLIFNGGLVPFYILVTRYLHLQDTLLALILPYLVVPWYVLLLRTYFASLPAELIEAAKIDGAGEWRVFFRIVIPLSTPALATVGLFSILLYWNDWWLGLLFIDNQNLMPLQLLLYNIMTNIDVLASNAQTTGVPIPSLSVRMAMAVLAIGPIALAYLFVQRFFIRGITLGGLKGD